MHFVHWNQQATGVFVRENKMSALQINVEHETVVHLLQDAPLTVTAAMSEFTCVFLFHPAQAPMECDVTIMVVVISLRFSNFPTKGMPPFIHVSPLTLPESITYQSHCKYLTYGNPTQCQEK